MVWLQLIKELLRSIIFGMIVFGLGFGIGINYNEQEQKNIIRSPESLEHICKLYCKIKKKSFVILADECYCTKKII